MTNGSPRTGRLPRDVGTRERLREAQLREVDAVAVVCAAQDRLRKACTKRDAAAAAATAVVDQAQASVESAQGALVQVSGLERAALLLGIDSADLRKIVSARNGRRSEG
jgi:chemotaxis regulatin CheY-phosphate phosphatase CheZ